MKKINLNFIKDDYKNIYMKFPLTFISIIILTIILALNSCKLIDIDAELINQICKILLLLIPSSFCVESINKKKNIVYYRLGAIICSVIISPIFFQAEAIELFSTRFILFYILGFILIGIYKNYKNSKLTFPKYWINVFSSLFKIGILYLITIIGVSILTLIFDELILNGTNLNYLESIIILITGLYLVPTSIYSLHDSKEATPFVKGLITKVCFSLLMIAYIIIYTYMIKILLTKSIPENCVYAIITSLFFSSLIISILATNNEPIELFKKLNKILPYLFIPLLILQTYTLFLRIQNYGLTPKRYLGIATIIFEIIYIILSNRKKDLSILIIAMISELFIGLLIPGINCFDLSVANQYKALKYYKDTDRKIERAAGAYNYLKTSDKGNKKIINLKLTKDQENKLENLTKNNDFYINKNRKTLYWMSSNDYINCEGYKKIHRDVSITYDEYSNNYKLDDKTNIDINNIINTYIKYYNENNINYDSYIDENREITINNKKIIFTNIDISFENINNEYKIKYCYINADILEK